MDDLKKRAYLARYLVRIDIPPDQLADQDISELNETVGWLWKYFFLIRQKVKRKNLQIFIESFISGNLSFELAKSFYSQYRRWRWLHNEVLASVFI